MLPDIIISLVERHIVQLTDQKPRSNDRQIAIWQRACYNDLIRTMAIGVEVILVWRRAQVLCRCCLRALKTG